MNRLTKKNNGAGSWTQLGDKYLPAHNIKHKQCVNKLGQLEDLEEEIGMSLLLLFRILKHGRIIHKYKIFCASKKMILESSIINGLFYESGQYGLEVYNEEDDIDEEYNDFKYVYIKDYGKTWAITRKELEDDK